MLARLSPKTCNRVYSGAYNLLLGSQRTARVTNTAATMEEIGRLLEKGLDKLILQFQNTPLYQEYTLARSTISLPGSKSETPVVTAAPSIPV
jgi:hypothetical protein